MHAGHIGGAYVWRKTYPTIQGFFKCPPNSEELLDKPTLCYAYQKRCRLAALREFGLDERATEIEIERKWRELVKVYHPDRNVVEDQGRQFMLLARAKERLNGLKRFSQKSESIISESESKEDSQPTYTKALPPPLIRNQL